MTLLEARLRAACPGRQLDLLNFGIGGAGVSDYRAIVTLGLRTYEPDLVLVNFYAGNDAPDLYRRVHERSRRPDARRLAPLDARAERDPALARGPRPRRRPGAAGRARPARDGRRAAAPPSTRAVT